jgi:putative hemolysin
LYLTRPQRLILAATTAVAMTVFVAGTFIGTSVPGGVWGRTQALLAYAVTLLLFGQLLPRAVARRWPSVVIPPLLPVLRIIEFCLMPLLVVVRRFTGESAREARQRPATDDEALGALLREGELEGVGEHTEIAIIEGVVNFAGQTVGVVMTPRSQIYGVEIGVPPVELARRLAQSGYSRVPMYRHSLDHIEGFVHAFDVLQATDDEAPTLRPVGITTPEAPCNELLFRMLRERKHLTVVRNTAGETVGLVTLEDLLEELVGEIRDEHDEPEARRSDAPS